MADHRGSSTHRKRHAQEDRHRAAAAAAEPQEMEEFADDVHDLLPDLQRNMGVPHVDVVGVRPVCIRISCDPATVIAYYSSDDPAHAQYKLARIAAVAVASTFHSDVFFHGMFDWQADPITAMTPPQSVALLAYSLIALCTVVKKVEATNLPYIEKRWKALVATINKGLPDTLTAAIRGDVNVGVLPVILKLQEEMEGRIDPRRVVSALVRGIPADASDSTKALAEQIKMVYSYHGMGTAAILSEFVAKPVSPAFAYQVIQEEAILFRRHWNEIVERFGTLLPFAYILDRTALSGLHLANFNNLGTVAIESAKTSGRVNANYKAAAKGSTVLSKKLIQKLSKMAGSTAAELDQAGQHRLAELGLSEDQIYNIYEQMRRLDGSSRKRRHSSSSSSN